MRRFFTMFLMLIFSGILAYGQTKTISGQVRDAQGNPAKFVTVTESGTKNATTTDENGNFSIRVKQSAAALVVSGVGYETQTVNATGSNVSVTLKQGTTELAAVVVTALGVQRQAKELGYSTAKVKAPELTQAKVVNLANGLTGKVSGLNIQTVNNGVFADTRITLRGIRSLTGNNQPMLILDGVPISLGLISTINPNDIADVTILKSSSATAVYGPDGANGAILITTKRGSKTNPTVTLSHTTQLERVAFMPRFQDQFGSGSSEDQFYNGVYDPIENQGYGPRFGDLSLATTDPDHFRIVDGKLFSVIGRDGPGGIQEWVPYYAQPNEKKRFWNTGITNQTDLSFAAGDFYMSFQNVDIKGVMPKDVNKRISIHLSSQKEFTKNIRANFNVQYTQGNYDVNAGSSFGNGRDYSPYWNLINTPMHIPITKYKNWQSDFFSSPDGFYNDYYYNPYWAVDNFRQRGRTDDILGNLEFNWKMAPWLNLTYRVGATYSGSGYKATQGALNYSLFAKNSGKSSAQDGDIPSAVFDNSGYSYRLNSELFATVRKEVGKFRLDGLFGHSYRNIVAKSQTTGSNNLGIPSVFNVSARRGEPIAEEGNSNQRLQRFFGKVSVGYNNWAFLEFSGSYDADSRLAYKYTYDYNNLAFFYPGVSASVVLSEAISSLKNSNTLSYLKLRGAVSRTGNVNLVPYSLENTFSQIGGFPYGNTLGFSANNTLRRSSYEPEFVDNTEAGIEVGFLKNRINLEATVYQQKNTNQMITVAYSSSTGFPSALLNAADFTNKGFELDLKLTPLVKLGDFNVDFKVNYTFQDNKVNRLIDGVDELGIGNGNFAIVGYPAYTFKLTDYLRDSLGRVIVNGQTGMPSLDPVAKIFGRTLPKHIIGLNLNVSYKGLTLSAVADYRGGNQIYHGIGPDMDFSGISYRSGSNDRQPFIFPNSVIETSPKVYEPNTSVYTQSGGYGFWSQGAFNTNINSNYLTSGAFWKLREVALTYTFPADMFGKKGIKGASVTFTGRNLFTWLPATNQWTDPEFSNTLGNAQGVNTRDNNPPTRIFGANVTLTF